MAENKKACGQPCEVFSRVVGYFRPVQRWNDGKQEEFKFRKTFSEEKALKKDFGKGIIHRDVEKEKLSAFVGAK